MKSKSQGGIRAGEGEGAAATFSDRGGDDGWSDRPLRCRDGVVGIERLGGCAFHRWDGGR